VKATLAPYTDSVYKTATPVTVLLTAAAPATITVPASSVTGNFTVSWSASTTTGAAYVLEQSSNGGVTWTAAYTGTATSANIIGLAAGTYTYRVKATRTGYVDSAWKISGNIVVTIP